MSENILGGPTRLAGGAVLDADSALTAIVDDFEDTGLSEYSGDTGNFSSDNGRSQNGSRALKADMDGTSNVIRSTSGLDRYPAKGDTFRVWVYANSGNLWTEFGVQDSNNYYQVRVSPANDAFNVAKVVSGSTTVLTSSSPSYSTGAWYEIKVAWADNDDIDATLFDSGGTQLSSLSTNDSTFSSETGIGMFVNSGSSTTGWWDYWRIV